MYFPSQKEFIKLAKQGNLIPVYKEIMADLETPVSAFKKIEGAYSFLLESVEGGEKIARYSFLGSQPFLTFKSKGSAVEIERGGNKERQTGNPLEILRDLLKQYKPVRIPGLPRFHGGAVGYLGYDLVHFMERIPDKNPDDLKLPDALLLFTDTLLAFDHIQHKILVISNALVENNPSRAYREATQKIENLIKKLKRPLDLKKLEREVPSKIKEEKKFSSNISKEQFKEIVSKAKEYIRAGDIIQVVLSQRFSANLKKEPFDIYRMLRTINPSPYMYYLKFPEVKLVGSSPEVMVRLEGKTATLRPIAGTRPRGETEEEDKKLEKELLASPKECAEHVMLVDLGRNDLGKVCEPGSVNVTHQMEIERYSHVMHIVSNVAGKLKSTKDCFDLLMASFPAGTVSGAPKIRAMEIIDELENAKRGPYAGAVGYFDFSGDLDTCITIRTILVTPKKAYVQAGAGIVADSDPEKEYLETVNKAGGMLRALASA